MIGVAAALVAGTVLGSIARLMMRLTSLAAGADTDFTVAGTAGILLAFVLFTLPGAVLAALLARRGRSALLVLGAVALAVPAVGVALEDLAHLGVLSSTQLVGVALATGGVFVAILALPLLTLRLVARGLARSPVHAGAARSRVEVVRSSTGPLHHGPRWG
jgi:hypothetical protein